jgi:hypothetical protein
MLQQRRTGANDLHMPAATRTRARRSSGDPRPAAFGDRFVILRKLKMCFLGRSAAGVLGPRLFLSSPGQEVVSVASHLAQTEMVSNRFDF